MQYKRERLINLTRLVLFTMFSYCQYFNNL